MLSIILASLWGRWERFFNRPNLSLMHAGIVLLAVLVGGPIRGNPPKNGTEGNSRLPLRLSRANVGAKNSHPIRAQQMGVWNGNKNTVYLLPVNYADYNPLDDWGVTPLDNAAASGNRDLVELLLADHADVNAKTSNGWTPLLFAAAYGHKDVVDLLLANHADANAVDGHFGWHSGRTPLHYAANYGDKGMAGLLLSSHADVNAEDHDGMTPLHLAAQSNHQNVAELLLGNHADANAKTYDGMTPLHYAVRSGDKEMVRLLLASHAYVNAKTERGDTPLLYAAQDGDKDMVGLLLASQADVNAKDGDRGWRGGWAPLHYAADSGRKDIVQLLLANHSDVNTKDNDGWTPLHYAKQSDHQDIVELLLANHADSELMSRSRPWLWLLVALIGAAAATKVLLMVVRVWKASVDRKSQALINEHPEIISEIRSKIPKDAPERCHHECLQREFVLKAIKYKKQGFDFKLAHIPAQTHREDYDDFMGPYSCEIEDAPATVSIERGDPLTDQSSV